VFVIPVSANFSKTSGELDAEPPSLRLGLVIHFVLLCLQSERGEKTGNEHGRHLRT
jgi:hypothetical protein